MSDLTVPAGGGADAATGESDAGRPALRLVRGAPTAEELAALIAVLAARSSGGAEPDAAPRSLWRDRAARLGAPLVPGPGAWRASGLPR